MSIAIISPQVLQQLQASGSPCALVDARPYADYLAGHLPGAVWMGWEDWCEPCPSHAGEALTQPGYWGVLGDFSPAYISARLALLGLHNHLPILVYADGSASKGREARIAWMLLYWGASHVWLLDGGWQNWLRQGGHVEQSSILPSRGCFSVTFQEQRRIRHHQLRQLMSLGQRPLLLDLRSQEEHEGLLYDYQPRLGCIPGSLHLPYTALFDDSDNFLSKERYLAAFPLALQGNEQLIPYCEVGVRSCIFALLQELSTGQVVPNYDGSFMQWALDLDLLVERKVRDQPKILPPMQGCKLLIS